MTGGRVLPLALGLWAGAAFGQVTATPVTAKVSIQLDGGTALARAYWATDSNGNVWAMANAGTAIEVFNVNGVQQFSLEPVPNTAFSSFALANPVTNGAATTTTLVAAADNTAPGCSTAVCLDIFFWDPDAGFQMKSQINTTVTSVTAMAIDATTSPATAINVYYATNLPSIALYEQSITVNSTNGNVGVGALNSRSLTTASATPGNVFGLAVDAVDGALFATDATNLGTLYSFPLDVTNLDGGFFSGTADGGFSELEGISFFSDGPTSTLYGGGFDDGIYVLNVHNDGGNIVVQQFNPVYSADGGPTDPSAASTNVQGYLTLVTEDLGPWLHIVLTDAGPDSGTPTPPVDAGIDAGGNPGVPIIAPGPGALPTGTNSCNCSSAGSAPVLLTLLLPLLLPRRRR